MIGVTVTKVEKINQMFYVEIKAYLLRTKECNNGQSAGKISSICRNLLNVKEVKTYA